MSLFFFFREKNNATILWKKKKLFNWNYFFSSLSILNTENFVLLFFRASKFFFFFIVPRTPFFLGKSRDFGGFRLVPTAPEPCTIPICPQGNPWAQAINRILTTKLQSEETGFICPFSADKNSGALAVGGMELIKRWKARVDCFGLSGEEILEFARKYSFNSFSILNTVIGRIFFFCKRSLFW